MARRRRYGQGTITQRSDGLWVAAISLGTGPDGKRLRPTVYAATREEAVEQLRRLRETSGNALPDLGSETFGQYLHRWLAARKPSVRPNTYACYESTVRNHLVPELGAVPLRDLAVGHIQHLLASSQAIVPATGKPKRSRRLVQLIRVVLRLALDHEGHWNRITAGVSRLALQVPAPEQKTTAWNADEAARFLAAGRDSDYEALWVLALTTGMRLGELLGLQWADIDLQGVGHWGAVGVPTIRVQHNLIEINGKNIELAKPKTEAGIRVIELTPQSPAVAALMRHRARLFARGQAALPQVFPSRRAKQYWGAPWPEAGLGYLLKNRVRKALRTTIARTGSANKPPVPELTFHELRHTAATLMLKNGTDVKIVQHRLGHKSSEVTRNRYQHVLPTMQVEAAAKLDAALGLTTDV